MKCAIHVLYNKNDLCNIEHNYKILSKTINHHFLITFIRDFSTTCKFDQTFCKESKFDTSIDQTLQFFKVLADILNYLNIKKFKNTFIISSNLKLHEYKSIPLTSLLECVRSIEESDFVIFIKNGEITDKLVLARIGYLISNLEYFDCDIESFKKRTNNRDCKFYRELFLSSPYKHSRNLEDYI